MPRKKDNTTQRTEVIVEQTLEDIMVASMMPYAEYVVLERALPRIEDGLKPVQRRILYAMMEMGVTPDKPHKKSARIVGDTMGKYHPHGDTSIYDAMARMAQDFNMGETLVDGHGNFGSVDGDSPAAMRYTEARMTPLALELLRDIDKDTVPFSLNYDDSTKEPDMLPGRFPNLLVNGSKGIAVGLATDIPPHNLGEVIDATCAMIDKPDISLEELMTYIKGPDFPTGAFIVGHEGIEQTYATGRGRIIMRAKAEIEDAGSGKHAIVVTELPYQINKARLLEEIQTLRESRKGILSGISEVRDESDREGNRAVIEVRKDADAQKILEYLYKHSDLQCTFNSNVVAIAKGKPRLMTLKGILEYYIAYQKEVVTRRTKFDLEKAQAREHILIGLDIAVRNIDEVVRIIKSSENVAAAKSALMKRFSLSGIQAQAILDMRLQRLTSLEVEKIENELREVQALIKRLKAILKSDKLLMSIIKDEMLDIKKRFAHKRRTKIIDAAKVKEYDPQDYIIVQDSVAVVTREGFVKRMNLPAYGRAAKDLPESLGATDEIKAVLQGTTAMYLRVITEYGFMYDIRCEDIPEMLWKNRGVHLSTLINGYASDEKVVYAALQSEAPSKGYYVFVSRSGLVKKSAAQQYDTRRKRLQACGVRDDDILLSAYYIGADTKLYMVSTGANAICFSTKEVSDMGRAAKGVKGMTLEDGESIVLSSLYSDEGEILILTDKGYGKRILKVDLERQNRAGKGGRLIAFNKNGSNGTRLVAAMDVREPYKLSIAQKSGYVTDTETEGFPISYKNSTGSPIVMVVLGDDICTARRCSGFDAETP